MNQVADTLGSLSNNDGNNYENFTWFSKNWIRAGSNFIALISSRSICLMLANFSGVEFLKTVSKFRKKKKVVFLRLRPPQNLKLGTFTLSSCSDGKEMYKKSDARAKLLFC